MLASVDGSNLGEVGARELVANCPPRPRGRRARDLRPRLAHHRRSRCLQAWSNDTRRAGIGLQRTGRRLDPPGGRALPGGSGTLGQLARLSFPIGIGSQGVLLERGYDAVRISGSGELRRRATARRRRSTRTGSAASGVPRSARSPRARRGPAAGARPEELHPGGEPGAARLGAVAPGRVAAPARCVASVDAFARARRRHVDVLGGCAGSARGSLPSSPRLRLPSCSRRGRHAVAAAAAPVPPDVLPLTVPAPRRPGGRARRDGARLLPRAGWRARPDPELQKEPDLGAGRRARPDDRRGLAPALAREPVRRARSPGPRRTCGCCSRSRARCRPPRADRVDRGRARYRPCWSRSTTCSRSRSTRCRASGTC